MTYEEWRATRLRVQRADRQYTGIFEDWDIEADEMFVYDHDITTGRANGYIEIGKAYNVIRDKFEMNEFETYYLCLENQDWYVTRDGLDKIEHILYDWMKDEGAFDTPEEGLEKSLNCHVHNINLRIGEYIKQRYPKATSGDIGPGVQANLDAALHNYIRWWIKKNTNWRNK